MKNDLATERLYLVSNNKKDGLHTLLVELAAAYVVCDWQILPLIEVICV